MAKRFIDTNLFDDEWFCNLSKDGKIFWIYFITKCNHAGILIFNKKLIEFQTGIKITESLFKEFDKTLQRVTEQLLFCPKFIVYQYPNFPQSQVMQQKGALELLKKYNLWDIENNSFLTVSKEFLNSYVYDNGIVGNNNSAKSTKEKTWREDFNIYLQECKVGYKEFVENSELIAEQSHLNPNVNILLTIEKGYKNFWGTEAGWAHKKRARTNNINWHTTIINSIYINKVYFTKEELV